MEISLEEHGIVESWTEGNVAHWRFTGYNAGMPPEAGSVLISGSYEAS